MSRPPGAWCFDWVRETNKELASGAMTASKPPPLHWRRGSKWIECSALALPREEGAPPELLALLEERQAARKAKDFKKSDAIRDELKVKGWIIEDTPKGPRLKKL